jgi:hypothetical protein
VHPRKELLSIAVAAAVIRTDAPTAKLTIHPQVLAFRRNRIGYLKASAYIDGMP